jgi:hypothetical protein
MSEAQTESVVKPHCILDDSRWKSESFVDIRLICSAMIAELQLAVSTSTAETVANPH